MNAPALAATAGERVAKLREIAGLVAGMSGGTAKPFAGASDIDRAYEAGSTLAKACFDDIADRAVALAASGVEAILSAGDMPAEAVALLAQEIEREVAQLEALLATPRP